ENHAVVRFDQRCIVEIRVYHCYRSPMVLWGINTFGLLLALDFNHLGLLGELEPALAEFLLDGRLHVLLVRPARPLAPHVVETGQNCTSPKVLPVLVEEDAPVLLHERAEQDRSGLVPGEVVLALDSGERRLDLENVLAAQVRDALGPDMAGPRASVSGS